MFSRNLQFCANCVLIFRRQFRISTVLCSKSNLKYKYEADNLEKLIEKHRNKIIYNCFIHNHYPNLIPTSKNFYLRKQLKREEKEKELKVRTVEPLPISLKYLQNEDHRTEVQSVAISKEPSITHFPFGNESAISISSTNNVDEKINHVESIADLTEKEIKTRQGAYDEVDHSKWMTDYENYAEAEENEVVNEWKINYGTPDPRSIISNIPCGGCGALLHCKDTAIPGYIPSEIYKNSRKQEGVHLKALVCQRCHFLTNYNLALQVRVTPEDYPKVLETIKQNHALIILLVDLLDFPCSIWPGIIDLLGPRKPIIVVGNKVDLLPRDTRGYLENIKSNLKETVLKLIDNQAIAHIKHVSLISAKTGWGVEELITKLHNIWSTSGNVYLVGCTNVGKSSLFNTLLQSDFCKVQAVDLVQRATTSVWPGTTLNLLKFPILRPSGWRLYVRTKRLQSVKRLQAEEDRLNKIQLQNTQDPKYATLMGHLDRTFSPEIPEINSKDPFAVSSNPNASGRVPLGIDDNDKRFAASKWCYDTPGVVQPDQIIHLLTAEELTLTLPKELIRPKTFGIRVGQTIFIAGLGRLDYIEGPRSIRLTVFCAEELPITMCHTEDAEALYEEFLGSEVFQVPKGLEERMNKWPGLKAGKLLKLVSEDKYKSCGDIVLSNAGWVSVTCDPDSEVKFTAWTPEAKGIYLRKSLLPSAVNLRGKKIRGSPAYESNKFFIPK